MEPDEQENFDDAELKAAIRRAWQKEAAPPELIERIRVAAVESGSEPNRFIGPSRRGGWRLAMAMAAVLLLGISLVGYRMSREAPSAPAVAALPESLASELVATHDMCCGAPDHHMPGLPRKDFDLIASVLTRRLGWPVLAGSLGDDWTFKGASICPVGPNHSAHLVFKHDNQDVSIFSLPVSVLPGQAENASYQQVEAGHPIASFSEHGGLFCVVGSSSDGSLTLGAVSAIREKLQPRLEAQAVSLRLTVALR
jgi:hypothetical protein